MTLFWTQTSSGFCNKLFLLYLNASLTYQKQEIRIKPIYLIKEILSID